MDFFTYWNLKMKLFTIFNKNVKDNFNHLRLLSSIKKKYVATILYRSKGGNQKNEILSSPMKNAHPEIDLYDPSELSHVFIEISCIISK